MSGRTSAAQADLVLRSQSVQRLEEEQAAMTQSLEGLMAENVAMKLEVQRLVAKGQDVREQDSDACDKVQISCAGHLLLMLLRSYKQVDFCTDAQTDVCNGQ